MKSICARAVLTGFCGLCLFADTGRTVSNLYIESFTTTTYKDAVNTTALWDVGTGELKLPPFAPSLLGTYNTPGSALGVAIAGDLAFVADASAGLQIVSIANPASLTLVGVYDTPGSALGVAVAGDLAFVADAGSGLRIINITNPASPTLVGFYDTPGLAFGVAVAGDLAFVADDASGLRIINIVNPASPTLVGFYDTPGSAVRVSVSGDLAFMADRSSGLRIINITNPANPSLVGFYDTPGDAQGVAVAGDLAFVGDGDAGVQVINVTNPASPALIATYDTPGFVRGVDVTGDLLFASDDGSGLQIHSIANPSAPALVNTFNTAGAASDVFVSGEFAFVGDAFAGLQIVRIMTPAFPRLVGTYSSAAAKGIAVAGDLAFVADDAAGLKVINIIDPGSPTLTGSYNTAGNALDVAVTGDLAFVADDASGLQIINITNPASPTLTGTYDTPGLAEGIEVAGDLAFVADGGSGLQIINITNPAGPTLTGTYDTPGSAEGIAVAGDLAFVADGGSGLQIINITNPAGPTLTGSYNTPGGADGVAVAGDLAFVADFGGGLQIINIANPASPTLTGTYDTPGIAYGIAVAGDLAFVADGSGLQIINITNAAVPVLVDTYVTSSNAWDVVVAGELAFVANDIYGLRLIEVLNHEFDTRGNTGHSLAIDGSDQQVVRFRLSSTQTAGVVWQLSADGGSNWQTTSPNVGWSELTAPGNELLWRTTHKFTTHGLNPTVSDLQIEWRYDVATVTAITDIPNDQGGWLRLQFLRSGLDFWDEPFLPILHYGVWRRVDDSALMTTLASAPQSADEIATPIREAFRDLPIFAFADRVFLRSSTHLATGTFPPGTWELVQTVPALQQDPYLAAIPTAADSTVQGMHYTVLVVTAHTTTPSTWYASPPDSGYSVDNIAPAVPGNFALAYNTGSGNALSWDPSPDDDFQYFRVYRSSDPDFTHSLANLVHSTTSTDWSDPDYDGWAVYYKVTALDYAGNESDPATAGAVTTVGGTPAPDRAALHQNQPNPCNPSTVIPYDVPRGGADVHLAIYDVAGRLVSVLISRRETEGKKTVLWEGRDDAGAFVATGVYLYRIQIGSFTATRKMVVLK